MIKIDYLSAFSDNYIWLLKNLLTNQCAVVDPGDPTTVLDWLSKNNTWNLSDILITHYHPDHIDGIRMLKTHTHANVYGPSYEKIPYCNFFLKNNEYINILGINFKIFHLPGHTLGHIAYYHDDNNIPILFCGDTLFSAGCGRIFEGTSKQMYFSLLRLAKLPLQTKIYCAHEYTLHNLLFAREIEPENMHIYILLQNSIKLRKQNKITLPSNMKTELEINPFIRILSRSLNEKIIKKLNINKSMSNSKKLEVLRSLKDKFKLGNKIWGF